MGCCAYIESFTCQKGEHVFKNDNLFFIIWFPVEQCNLNKNRDNENDFMPVHCIFTNLLELIIATEAN